MKKTVLLEVAEELGISEKEVLKKISFLKSNNRPKPESYHLLSDEMLKKHNVTCTGIGNIVNDYGDFLQYSFVIDDKWEEYSVLVKAASYDEYRKPIFILTDYFLTRFDSHCETQMLFGDQTCDCMGQLEIAMKKISERGEGAIIHIKKHEGRGKGIASKLDQLSICNVLNIDTVLASKLRAELVEGVDCENLPATAIIDERDFLGCVAIMKYFNVPTKVKLLLQTNNPYKMKALIENGYNCEFYNIHTVPNENNKHHLAAKKTNLNHKL